MIPRRALPEELQRRQDRALAAYRSAFSKVCLLADNAQQYPMAWYEARAALTRARAAVEAEAIPQFIRTRAVLSPESRSTQRRRRR